MSSGRNSVFQVEDEDPLPGWSDCKTPVTLHQHFNLIRSTRLRGTTTSRVHPHPAQVPAVEEKPAAAQVPAVEVQPHAEGTYLDCATEEHTHTHIHHAKRKSLQMWKLSEKVPGRTGRGQKISPGVLVQIGPLHTITNTTHLCTPLNMYINSYSIKALKPYNNR
ncbi:uncharacterized protein LOC124379752 isoform X7 [Silurus meridionalis]|uniref:uncharacterized protein LOC124379752 isoform X7 n=1 Tax=Silurus meridionalis TaxID=175797 RepID=UPI001EEC4AA6|nr:uncharacterized protein LOC124379752 isoform X7 [Silurus meridionalis]